jgi:hypothetical protein
MRREFEQSDYGDIATQTNSSSTFRGNFRYVVYYLLQPIVQLH